jgi:hypothetical protein
VSNKPTSALGELRRLRPKMEKLETQLDEMRKERNSLILQTLTEEGVTEREAAMEAGVSAAYAHRIKKHNGAPPSGPALEKQRQAA